ncbi:hypothetical protein FH5_02150 [Priestia endophytica]|nr:hypothetical protein FH5_02150 [Priestia endophytica]
MFISKRYSVLPFFLPMCKPPSILDCFVEALQGSSLVPFYVTLRLLMIV